MSNLFDFAVTTIFAREFLEGAIIIGEYRTIVLRSDAPEENKKVALSAIWTWAIIATLFALLVIAAVATPLLIISSTFDNSTSKIIEGVSKIVAGICLLGLSLKIPKFLGIYGSCKPPKEEAVADGDTENQEDLDDENNSPSDSKRNEVIPGLTMHSIRFNVAWNIWREVAECGVFLIPSFLSGENLKAIPISALIGSVAGLLVGVGIYEANRRFKNRLALTIFAVLLLVFLSAGLTTGGCHNLEVELGSTRTVWEIHGDFWDINRLPMTIFKPFGYNDSRTVLEICIYWGWLLLSAVLHVRKYRRAPKPGLNNNNSQIDRRVTSMEDELDDEPENDNEVGKPDPKDEVDDLVESGMAHESQRTEESSQES